MKKHLLCAVAVSTAILGLSGVSAHAQAVTDNPSAQTVSVAPAAPAATPAPRPSFLSDNGKFVFFAGYSFLDTNVTQGNDGDGDCNVVCFGRTEGSGFALSGTYMLNSNFGLTADFSGNYGGVRLNDPDGDKTYDRLPQNSYYILFGPTVSKRVGKINLSAHALAGVARLWAADEFTDTTGVTTRYSTLPWNTGLAIGLGGSADWMVSEKWGWRIAQVDWLWSDGQQSMECSDCFVSHTPVSAVRISTGIVFNFGGMR